MDGQGETARQQVDRLEQALLSDFAAVVALRLACDRGVLRRLSEAPRATLDLGLPEAGAGILMAMLLSAKVVRRDGDSWALTDTMAALVNARGEGLEARVRFTAMAAADVLAHGDSLLDDLPRLMSGAQTFSFFRYDRAQGTKAAQLEDTAPWVRYVTALSEAEAPALAPLIPLAGCTSLLEIGGNTGAFALALLERRPGLTATVLDLPAVCRLAEMRLAAGPDQSDAAQRLRFHPGDARVAEWPGAAPGIPAQAVLFKSVLHDWEKASARDMLARAVAYLPPGGRLIVCERGAFRDEAALSGIGVAANLVFASFYRPPEFYEAEMRALGLVTDPPIQATLDMTFHVITGRKPE